MTPGARLQSAIEILDEIFRSGRPADRVFDTWSRSSRFAGSKDRTAVSEIVFTVLRRRAELAAACGSDEARLLALAALRLIDAKPLAEIEALADGGRHAPAPLTGEERAALDAASLPGADAPPHVRFNYPEFLQAELERAFGPRLEAEMAALLDRAPTDLRVNTLKSSRDKALAGLAEAGIAAEHCALSPWGIRLLARANLPGLALFRDGAIEIQDEGSQLACLLSAVKPGEQVVDLCAGGGGKSLALAAMMGNRGQIYACDIDGRRLGGLVPRTERAGIRNLQTRVLEPFRPGEPDASFADLEARADCVLADAPCSGTGAWRRSPDARWRLTPEMLAGYCAAQDEVLARGARLVRPGGRLVYVTCSLLPSENEERVAAFAAANPGFVLEDWQAHWPDGLPALPAPAGGALRLSPVTAGTDGFFIAILRREAGA
ncbi:MAG: RsmB/NOP family class I SAM-dependent RNA methyltransferase [Parvibaculum sp.]|nr:RsmB/NOP family class I SAM-dependent RNA methyltransferase [Parvibaculum sp.]